MTAQGVFLDLCLRSRERYPDFAAALKEETGVDVEYRTEGALHLALDDDEAERLRETAEHQRRAGFVAEWLDGSEVRKVEPDLTHQVRGALLVPGDHHVENRKLVTALIRAVERAGAQLRPGTPVTGLAAQGPRVIGVRTPMSRLAAGVVVNAAGCWAGWFPSPEAPERPRVRPVKGQMLACAMGPEAELHHTVVTHYAYLVPRADGRLLVGATVEEAGFDKRVTVDGVQRLLAAGVEALPGLVERPLVDAWAGLAPWHARWDADHGTRRARRPGAGDRALPQRDSPGAHHRGAHRRDRGHGRGSGDAGPVRAQFVRASARGCNRYEMITVEVNGESREIPDEATILELLKFVNLMPEGVAVAVNGKIVPAGRALDRTGPRG